MPYRRLTDKHPTKQKYEKLLEFMDQLGLKIEVQSYYTFLIDRQQNEKFIIADAERNPSDISSQVKDFPDSFETSLWKEE